MSAQGISRKRPAPGTMPIGQQPLQPLPQYPTAPPQLSDDQFLRWGQNPQANGAASSYADPSNFNNPTYSSNQTNSLPSNQLTRRPTNQLASRGKSYSDSGGTWVDPNQGPTDPVEGSWTEKEEDLEQKAQLAKRDAMSKRKQIPPFVQKLASFLEQSKNTDLIRWSDDGNSFIVLDEDEFAKNLIPELFKHNNYPSFVRQLNMYGFHKKVGLSDNSMRASEKKNKSPSEYSNPYFKRGHPELLWLIQKPKNMPGQGPKASGKPGSRVKTESDGIDDDPNDDYVDGDFTTTEQEEPRKGGGTRPKGPLLIRQGDGLPHDQLASVHRELQTIRQQQQVISGAINKLRREHEQLYGQAANFQNMHDRHENSITAILTFLATVYNRSLEGHGAQNMANMFAGVIPHDQNQGNVVDVGDVSYTDLNSDGSQVQRPFKKQPLLLKAPPAAGQDGQSRAGTISPSTAGTPFERPQTRQYMSQMQQIRANQNDQLRNIEEVTDPATPQYMANQQAQNRPPQRDIMSVIHNTNARNNLPGMSPNASDFPTVLTSLENSDGNSPLTPSQRADMLRLIANGTNAQNENNNALMSPNPPQMPDMSQLARTREEINKLVRMQTEQDKSVQNLTNLLQPLSPTGSIPGLTDNNDFNGMGSVPPALDLDQIFNSGDYFNDTLLGNDFNLDGHGDPSGNPNDFNFDDFGGDGVGDNGLQGGVPDIVTDDGNDDGGGRIIEAVNSSEGTSPATTAEENGSLGVGYGDDYGERSPGKKRRKNR